MKLVHWELVLYFILINLFLPFVSCHAGSGSFKGEILVSADYFIPDGKFSDYLNCHSQTGLGISFGLKKKEWPIRLAFESSFFYEESNIDFSGGKKKIKFLRSDTGLGIKKIFNEKSFANPFISGGLYMVRMYGEISETSDNSVGLGYWGSGGIHFKVTDSTVIGFQFKYTKADISFFNFDGNAGGHNFEVMSGFYF